MTLRVGRGPDHTGHLITMVKRQDVRTLNEQTREVQQAIDEFQELHEQSQKSGVTVDASAYSDAQERVKTAVNELVHHSDDMIDRTDTYEDEEGNMLVDLPNAALARDGDSTTKPSTQ